MPAIVASRQSKLWPPPSENLTNTALRLTRSVTFSQWRSWRRTCVIQAAVKLPCVGDDPCGSVHDTLKLVSCRRWCDGQQTVAVVDACGDERMHKYGRRQPMRQRANGKSDAAVAADRSIRHWRHRHACRVTDPTICARRERERCPRRQCDPLLKSAAIVVTHTKNNFVNAILVISIISKYYK